MAIDYTTATGQVRLLISDVDEEHPVLSNEMVGGFLARYGLAATAPPTPRGSISRAAADALDAIASSEALVGKKIRTGDGLNTDGPAVAAALREHAARLRARADDEDVEDGLTGGYFGVVEFQPLGPTSPEAVEAPVYGW